MRKFSLWMRNFLRRVGGVDLQSCSCSQASRLPLVTFDSSHGRHGYTARQHDQYIAAALEHADQAITNGHRRNNNNALAEQATVALRYTWLAERSNNKDGRLQDAIHLFKETINHARYGRTQAGVQAVKDAYKLLAEIE